MVDKLLEDRDERLTTEVIARLDYLREHGNESREPISKALRDGIFELRARAVRRQVRLLYYFSEGKKIVFVLALFKKTSKIDNEDIKKAVEIRRLIQEKEGFISAVTHTS